MVPDPKNDFYGQLNFQFPPLGGPIPMRSLVPGFSSPAPSSSGLEAFGRSLADAALWGFDDELAAMLGMGEGDTWEARRRSLEARKKLLSTEHPFASFLGGIAGAFTPAGLYGLLGKTAFKGLAKTAMKEGAESVAPSVLSKTVKDVFNIPYQGMGWRDLARSGAIYGGLHGLGAGEGLEGRLSQAGLEAALGGVFSPVAGTGLAWGLGKIGGLGERLGTVVHEIPGLNRVFDPVSQAAYRLVSEYADQADYSRAMKNMISGAEPFMAESSSTVMDKMPGAFYNVLRHSLGEDAGLRDVLRGVQRSRTPASVLYESDIPPTALQEHAKTFKEKTDIIQKRLADEVARRYPDQVTLDLFNRDLSIVEEFKKQTYNAFKNLKSLTSEQFTDPVEYTKALNKDFEALFRDLYQISGREGLISSLLNIRSSPIFKELSTEMASFHNLMRNRGIDNDSILYYHELSTYLDQLIAGNILGIQKSDLINLKQQIQSILRRDSPLYDFTQSLYHEYKLTNDYMKLGQRAFMKPAAEVAGTWQNIQHDTLQKSAFQVGFFQDMKDSIVDALNTGAVKKITNEQWANVERVYGPKVRENIYDWFQFMKQRSFVDSLDTVTGSAKPSVLTEFLPYTIRVAMWGRILQLLTLSPKVDIALSKLGLMKAQDVVKVGGKDIVLKDLIDLELKKYKKYKLAKLAAGSQAGKYFAGITAEDW